MHVARIAWAIIHHPLYKSHINASSVCNMTLSEECARILLLSTCWQELNLIGFQHIAPPKVGGVLDGLSYVYIGGAMLKVTCPPSLLSSSGGLYRTRWLVYVQYTVVYVCA